MLNITTAVRGALDEGHSILPSVVPLCEKNKTVWHASHFTRTPLSISILVKLRISFQSVAELTRPLVIW